MANDHVGSASQALKAVATGGVTKEQLAAMKPKDQVKHYLEANKDAIARAMPKHMSAQRLLQVATTAILSTPKLLECYLPTLIGGVVQCAQMGLEPNTVLGHAYLVPFKNSRMRRKDVQVIIGYKGFIDLARRSGNIVSIAAHAVRQHDEFKYRYGLREELDHVPADGDRGEITHFYAVAHMKDGGHAFEVLTKGTVDRIRATTNGRDNAVWNNHYEEMGRKTAIRRLAKFLPLSVELATAVAMDDAAAAGTQGDLSSVLDGDFTIDTGEDMMQHDDDAQDQQQEPAKPAIVPVDETAPPAESDRTKLHAESGSNAQQEAPTGEYVAELLGKARTKDALQEAADLIRSVVPDSDHAKLHTLYQTKLTAFEAMESGQSGGKRAR